MRRPSTPEEQEMQGGESIRGSKAREEERGAPRRERATYTKPEACKLVPKGPSAEPEPSKETGSSHQPSNAESAAMLTSFILATIDTL